MLIRKLSIGGPFLRKRSLIMILASAFFLALSAPAGAEAEGPRCGDFLAKAGKKPPGLEFTGCQETDSFGLKVLWADYRVPGAQAEAVENYLIEQAGMGPLVFHCCIWEIKDFKRGYIEHNQKRADPDIDSRYEIQMGSGETFHYPREFWAEKMDWFYVTVLLHLESP